MMLNILAVTHFFKTLHDEDAAIWVVPGLIFFEFQATQSRRYRDKNKEHAFRHAPLFYENTELYKVTKEFLIKVWELNLYDRFNRLKGADLLYACIAYVEGIPLVTHDSDFNQYKEDIELIKPRELYST